MKFYISVTAAIILSAFTFSAHAAKPLTVAKEIQLLEKYVKREQCCAMYGDQTRIPHGPIIFALHAYHKKDGYRWVHNWNQIVMPKDCDAKEPTIRCVAEGVIAGLKAEDEGRYNCEFIVPTFHYKTCDWVSR
jgi:hypothetical protein